MPFTGTGKPFADKGRRIEKVNRPRATDRLSVRKGGSECGAAAELDHPAGIAFILRQGALDEGENQGLDGRREPHGTASEKFYRGPITPTLGTSYW
jgi:hypothetical protein